MQPKKAYFHLKVLFMNCLFHKAQAALRAVSHECAAAIFLPVLATCNAALQAIVCSDTKLVLGQCGAF